LQSKYPRIDEIFFLSHNLVKHYVSTILQKEVIRNVTKSLNMLEVQSQENQSKKTTYIYFWKFTIIYLFWGQSGFSKKIKIFITEVPNLKKYLSYLAFILFFSTRINNIENGWHVQDLSILTILVLTCDLEVSKRLGNM